MTNFSLKRGLDIPILGSPEQKIYESSKPKTLALIGTDFKGLKPQMLISEGDKVERGTPLFCNKDYPEIIFVSPCKGYVQSINRGERRVLLSVVIVIEDLLDKGTNYIEKHNKNIFIKLRSTGILIKANLSVKENKAEVKLF